MTFWRDFFPPIALRVFGFPLFPLSPLATPSRSSSRSFAAPFTAIGAAADLKQERIQIRPAPPRHARGGGRGQPCKIGDILDEPVVIGKTFARGSCPAPQGFGEKIDPVRLQHLG